MIPLGLYSSWRDVPTGDDWIWSHFTPQELACKCGRHCAGEYFHSEDLLFALEALRTTMRRPLQINSGRRCALHNAEVHGAALSEHKLHVAADISLRGHDAEELAIGAAIVGFRGLGFGVSFLHVDMRRVRAGFHYPGGKAPWTKRFGFDPAVRFKLTGRLH